jgi:hypothetical protein
MEDLDVKTYDPDMQLNHQEVADLAGIVYHPGFKVFQKLAKSVVDQFVVSWINKEKDEEVLRAHRHAKVAAQFYTMLIKRIDQEVTDLVTSTKLDQTPIDSAAALDLDGYDPSVEETLL